MQHNREEENQQRVTENEQQDDRPLWSPKHEKQDQQQIESYSEQLSNHNTSEEQFNEDVNPGEDIGEREKSEAASWSSEAETEKQEEQIFETNKQRHSQERQLQQSYSWRRIREDQGLFLSLSKELNGLKQKMNSLEKQHASRLCNGCGLLRSNLIKKTVESVELNTFFCAQCDSKYATIKK